jgi:DNA-binding SARP family transcriptional activator/tetratricopeptide (TPR) repeat protein
MIFLTGFSGFVHVHKIQAPHNRTMQAQPLKPHTATPSLRLELLGGASLRGIGVHHNLERKTAAVLAMLALEGEITRSKVAGLLWSDTDEERARANLRQCLHRFRKLIGIDLVNPGERMSLNATLEVDTLTLESRAFLGDDAGLIAVHGEILEQLDFEDCPEFNDWLMVQRERWLVARVGAYRRALQNLDANQALEWAQEWINLEPISEEAHRALARVYQKRGNRALALQTIRDLETLLQHELATGLSLETKALQTLLERDEFELEVSSFHLPHDVLNPISLVGREHEWALLERAWKTGLNMVIRGVPGVGKSRLMTDFLKSKSCFDLIGARPGDAGTPMASIARGLRQVLNQTSSLELPVWVETELARLIPELSLVAPTPINSETDKLRFFEALFTVSKKRFAAGINALAIDDLQFMDAASFEATQFNAERLQQLGIRTISTYRIGELSPEFEAQLESAAATGKLQIVDLQPLEADAFASLIDNLQLDLPPGLASRLQHSTGGNPLFALETIRDLLEQNALHGNLEQLPLPAVVKQITAQRLERRSLEAQRVAQVAAIAGIDFGLELGAFVLETKALDLQQALSELEDAQIMHGERFAHDLLLESVLEGMSESVKRFLHRRCAAFLEETGDAARVAEHWLKGQNQVQAIPWLLRAADDAQKRYRLSEASEFAERAGHALAKMGDTAQAFSALERAVNHRISFDMTQRLEDLVEALFDLARNDNERARAWLAKVKLLNAWQFAPKAEIAALQGLKLEISTEPIVRADLQAGLAESLWRQGKHVQAISALQPALEGYKTINDTRSLAQAEGRLGIIYGDSEDHAAARDHLERSVQLLENLSDDFAAAKSRNMLGITLGRIGLVRDALAQHKLVRATCERIQGADVLMRMNFSNMGQRLFDLDQYSKALEITTWSLEMTQPELGWARAYSKTHQVRIKLRIGAFEGLAELLEAILAVPDLREDMLFDALLLRSKLRSQTGLMLEAQNDLTRVRSLLPTNARPFSRIELDLAEANVTTPEHSLELAQNALDLATRYALNGLQIGAYTRLAQALIQLGKLELAFEHSSQANELLKTYDCTNFYRAESWWTHTRLLMALEKPEAKQHSETLVNWVLTTNTEHVPTQYQTDFLEHNAVNHAILELAKNAN